MHTKERKVCLRCSIYIAHALAFFSPFLHVKICFLQNGFPLLTMILLFKLENSNLCFYQNCMAMGPRCYFLPVMNIYKLNYNKFVLIITFSNKQSHGKIQPLTHNTSILFSILQRNLFINVTNYAVIWNSKKANHYSAHYSISTTQQLLECFCIFSRNHYNCHELYNFCIPCYLSICTFPVLYNPHCLTCQIKSEIWIRIMIYALALRFEN